MRVCGEGDPQEGVVGRKRRFTEARMPRSGPPSFLQRTDDLFPKTESAGDPAAEGRPGWGGMVRKNNGDQQGSSPLEPRTELQPRKPLQHGE